MKSAYELAMERLEREEPGTARTLTDQQKAKLAEIDRRFEAKIAEREIFLKGQLAKAPREERPAIEQQLRNERLRLQEEAEREKEKVRQA